MIQSDRLTPIKRVLVCRPLEESLALVEAFEKRGVRAFAFPTLELRALSDRNNFDQILSLLPLKRIYIFVSPNAVKYAFSLMTTQQTTQCKASLCIAVGQSTKLALQQQGVSQVISPDSTFNSEAVLALPALQSIHNQHFFLVSGQEGRDLIETTLKARGAVVHKVVCYESICPSVNPNKLIETWNEDPFDCVIITSQRMLEHLWILLKEHQFLLQHTYITVMSDRIQQWAQAHDIKKWIKIQDPSIQGIVYSVLNPL